MKRVFWYDETKDQNGVVIQAGTPISHKNMNNMEERIDGNEVGLLNLLQYLRQNTRSIANVEGEAITVSLTNTKKYPFNNSDKLVTLKKVRDNLDYTVFVEVTSKVGNIEKVEVFDKQLNGFKVKYSGSASAAELKVYVRGGLK